MGKELQEFRGAVTAMQLPDDLAGSDVQSREQLWWCRDACSHGGAALHVTVVWFDFAGQKVVAVRAFVREREREQGRVAE